jgi:hypothetical protein
MCFYEQIVFACGDFKWSRFKQHCNKEYRTGETCGMKLVMDTQRVRDKCSTCQKIETKLRRRAKEEERIARWNKESNRSASIAKSTEDIRQLDQEIYALNLERQKRSNTLT